MSPVPSLQSTALLKGRGDRADRTDPGGTVDIPFLRPTVTRGRLVLVAVLGAWLPLVVLTILQASSVGAGVRVVLEQQVALHVRGLVSIPLLILADRICVPRLWRIVDQFLAADLITDRLAFDAALARARHAMAPGHLRVAIVILGFVASAAVALSIPVDRLPEWH